MTLTEYTATPSEQRCGGFFHPCARAKWIAVSGIVGKTVIVIFRGDGGRDIGRLADACFYDVGQAGGHRNMGRAEFSLAAVPENVKVADFVLNRLPTRKLRRVTCPSADDKGSTRTSEQISWLMATACFPRPPRHNKKPGKPSMLYPVLRRGLQLLRQRKLRMKTAELFTCAVKHRSERFLNFENVHSQS